MKKEECRMQNRGPRPAGSRLWLFAFFSLHSGFCLRVLGQSYSIDWQTIDGGGGDSSGGVSGAGKTRFRLILNTQALSHLIPRDQSFALIAGDGLIQLPQVFEVFDAFA